MFRKSIIFSLILIIGLVNDSGAQTPPPPVADKDLAGYLFTYFTGNRKEEEQIRFAISQDGYTYFKLNDGQPIVNTEEISHTGGVRDPHLLRCEDGKTFYMVVTDMTSHLGWTSNRGLVLMRSNDLVDWEASPINIQNRFSGHEDLLRVWAPQTIYDAEADKYMVYFSMKHGDSPDIIYYAYANSDFTDLEMEPKQLFFPSNGKSCIDGDIVFKDGTYYMFYKTEGHGNGIKLATTNSLTSGKWTEYDDYKQQTTKAVEGSTVFKLNHQDKYIFMYDVYANGEFQFTESSDLMNFTIVDHKISMDFKPRHGSVLPVTRSEIKKLTQKWGTPQGFPTLAKNPVLEGYYADPDVMYSHNTGKYYIYPTSDGFDGWGGYYFKTFSSKDLVEWKDEGVILDLKADVPWAGRNAWAPCIFEDKVGENQYKYYFYFTGAQKIGVAVADHPAGPYTDSGKPIVAREHRPEGINGGQEIDPAVFEDPRTGKRYLYWGNGYMAVAELNDDMVTIKPETIKAMTPDRTFREAIEVFYRDGKYYFLWSEDDTRSENYRVRYATSNSPLGPLTIPEDNLILAKDPSQGIYGTGHNSVLQIPGKDEWYIVYHRFNIPNGIKMGDSAGFHRETCIDRMEFDSQGNIIPVIPTR